jgi:hypothetical protein
MQKAEKKGWGGQCPKQIDWHTCNTMSQTAKEKNGWKWKEGLDA